MKKRGFLFRKSVDIAVRAFSALAVALAAAAMLWIFWELFARGGAALSWSFLTNPSKPYGIPDGGVANALLGTVFITSGAAVLGVVPAVCAGIYLAEFRDTPKLSAAIRFAANVLMGMPSVLSGLFVYTVMVAPTGRFSGLAASVALAVIMFPVVMRTTEDMLSMVPYALRESALALGMSRMRTTLLIVCRSAGNGLLTGILLSLSRVAGETAPLLFTALFADSWPTDYFSGPTANMPVLITEYSTNSPFAAMHAAGWGAALTVTALVFLVNMTSRILFREKHHGN
ncbi:MAG: phosphate ABC transporter permease PstA [Victivallaceae bacterium]|nr:phosphate ABC transporter permease PstA [Victivallaceae bacterium]